MSNNIFDLEQQIQDCWKVTDDIELITNHLVECIIDGLTVCLYALILAVIEPII